MFRSELYCPSVNFKVIIYIFARPSDELIVIDLGICLNQELQTQALKNVVFFASSIELERVLISNMTGHQDDVYFMEKIGHLSAMSFLDRQNQPTTIVFLKLTEIYYNELLNQIILQFNFSRKINLA